MKQKVQWCKKCMGIVYAPEPMTSETYWTVFQCECVVCDQCKKEEEDAEKSLV